MVNEVTLIGNLGKDPEVIEVSTGNKLAKFSLATNESYKPKDSEEWVKKTQWHNIEAWRYPAEFAEKHVKSGDRVYVKGKIEYDKYEDKDGNKRTSTKIIVNQIKRMDKRDSVDSPTPSQAPRAGADDFGDLPF